MRTVRDEMVEIARKFGSWGTSDGIELLQLENTQNNTYAGNTYMTALSVIRDLAKENEELKRKLDKKH